MMTIRRSEDRGAARFGWLDSRHSFSFGHYFDPDYMGHGPLRVINEDRVRPGRGFDTHGHSDMEIISYVLQGDLAHEDSMGNGSTLRKGDVQRMTAGTGVRHSEFNGSDTDDVHFLQIWIIPERQGLQPGYEEKAFSREDKLNRLLLVASREGREGSLVIHRDVDLRAGIIEAGRSVEHAVHAGRKGWLQVAHGSVEIGGDTLAQGDGAALEGPLELAISAREESEVLLFDMG